MVNLFSVYVEVILYALNVSKLKRCKINGFCVVYFQNYITVEIFQNISWNKILYNVSIISYYTV